MTPYESALSVKHDKSDNYYLNTQPNETNKKPAFFGAVQIKKSYVAFHLMPLYCHPELLDDVSPELKKKMQGKSCFNFKTIDDQLFTELEGLTKTAFDKYKAEKKI
ncbi:MAG: hypothetical protein AAF960_06300 [Bacteroidota bacterium]